MQSQQAGSAARGPLPRSARLLKPADFNRVFSRNRASTDSLFRVIARKNDLSWSRLGMAVSRKVDKRAVERNRIKRVVRESFRAWNARTVLEGGESFDIVVLPRAACATMGNEKLFQSLSRHWSRIEGQGASRKTTDG